MTRFATVAEAEHYIHGLGRPAHTTFDGAGVVVGFTDPPEGARGVGLEGTDRLTGVVKIDMVLAESAIDRVVVLGGGDAEPDQELDTRDFIRPVWRSGRWTLVVQPALGGRLVPFEPPEQIPCCSDHRG